MQNDVVAVMPNENADVGQKVTLIFDLCDALVILTCHLIFVALM